MNCAHSGSGPICATHQRHLLECVRQLAETNNRLNRRVGEAESAARTKVEEVLRAGPSLGRALSAWAAGDYRRRLEAIEARLPKPPAIEKACRELGDLTVPAMEAATVPCNTLPDCPCPRCKFDRVNAVLRQILPES